MKIVQRPCETCPIRASCVETCAAIESLLSSESVEPLLRKKRPTRDDLTQLERRLRESKLIVSWRHDLPLKLRRALDARFNNDETPHDRSARRYLRRALDQIGQLAVGERAS